jgi:hypothetical protein
MFIETRLRQVFQNATVVGLMPRALRQISARREGTAIAPILRITTNAFSRLEMLE